MLKKEEYKINSVNPLYLHIYKIDGFGFIEEKGGNKYLNIACTDNNDEVLKKYEPYLCNRCHDLMQKAMNFNNVAIVSIKGNDYRIHVWYMSKDETISTMHNSSLNEKTGLL